MGTLKRRDGELRPIPSRLLIGRSASCGLRLAGKLASSEHAAITWIGSAWTIRDLGSKNGTYVDGVHLTSGVPHRLRRGAVLSFGDREESFELVEDGPPGATATELATGLVLSAPGILVLPSEEEPLLTLYEDAAGNWVEEDLDGETRILGDEEVIVVGGRSFLVQLPAPVEGTPARHTTLALSTLTLELAVSKNEEKVEIRLLDGATQLRLEPREHAYVLLTLARALAEDAELPPDERGWRTVEELERMLAIDSNALNVSIHRARQQLKEADIVDAANIVEVRRGKRRLGTSRFRIVALD